MVFFSLFLDGGPPASRARLLYSPFCPVNRCGAGSGAGLGEPAGVPEEPATVSPDASDHPAEPGAAASAPAAARSRQPAAPAGGWSLAQSRCDWTHNAESVLIFLCSKSRSIRSDSCRC